MVTNDTDRLLARYFAGELSPQDKIHLEKWLAESQENEDYFFELTSLYQNVGTTDYPSFATQEAFGKLEEHIGQQTPRLVPQQKSKRKLLIWSLGAAAAIALLAIIFTGEQGDAYTVITEKRLYSFADSTKIDLMDGEIYLSDNQANDTIFLKGKAFFEMESEKTGSKIIKAGNVYVKDIGTSFTVDANTPDSIYVSVAEGEVLFYSDTNTGIKLGMNESGYYLSKSDKFYQVIKTGSFRFDETSLGEVITRLNEFYGQQIELKGKNMQNLPITVTFADEDLPTILDVVAATLNLKASHNESGYVIE
ncbi:FecR domain-containing protein [Dysgonomonas sp. 511]|uniref:FecR domain-containing protein n=1 Tax=Dysgonomonas sp. 511 TaxID=2302930 RepID=UPI0013CFBF07|nr:FecR domain-containing protein [Dysgonomonas sp. 511]NDV78046.1 DUF4974 domain-containing protein [Dysgonomonas sp. 511]